MCEIFDKEVPLLALFEAPTVAGLAAAVEKSISGRSRDWPPVVRVPRDRPLPLSMNQEQLWTLDQMIPGTHLFNMPYVYRLRGDLKLVILERTLKEIIRRHEAIRVFFPEVDGRPVQMIKEDVDFELPVIDLRSSAANDLRKQTAALIFKERVLPFDLAVGPLFRTKLLRLTDQGVLLLVTMHHIISDQWSMHVFRREFIALYEAFSLGHPSSLPDLHIQFVDFASWERQSLDSEFMRVTTRVLERTTCWFVYYAQF